MNDRDFAVVVGINRYREKGRYQDLHGPTNDAEEFIAWLKQSGGGGLPKENVDPFTRLSSKRKRDHPTQSEIASLLRDLFGRASEDGPVGRRLYVFLAGHGFTNSVALSLLHSAETTPDFPAFVSGTQWLDCFHQRALFEELVLCMDCCRDFVSNVDMPSRPCTNAMDSAANKVKRLYLLATGLNKGAFEEKFGKKIHGYFSRALLDALREDAIDGDGRLTAASVADVVREKLEPASRQNLNIFPDPVVSPGFVLFDDRKPRSTSVTVRSLTPTNTIEVFAGNDENFANPIPPRRTEGDVKIFDLPRGKTYFAQATNARGRTVKQKSLSVRNVALAVEL